MLRITNRTGLTIVTSHHASSPCVAIGDGPAEMPAAAWEHTLLCGPGLRSLVGEGPGMIEVVDMAAPVAIEPDVVADPIVAPVEAEPLPEAPKASTLASSLTSGIGPIDETLAALTSASRLAPQGKGKHRR